MKSFHIELEKESYLDSNAYTIGLLNTNYTDFSDPPIFSKKTSINNPQNNKIPFVNYSNTAYNINKSSDYVNNFFYPYSNSMNNGYNYFGYGGSNHSFNNKKKTRKQEIQLEIERNSLIQLNLILQTENSPLRLDYLINIFFVLGGSFFAYILEVIFFDMNSIIM